MFSVWVLVFYMGTSTAGGPALIDNIGTKDECERVAAVIAKNYYANRSAFQCLEVVKRK